MNKIKEFYIDNFKLIKKSWINQVAISFFGLFVTFPISALASNTGLGDVPVLLASLFSIAFYFFLIYDSFWEFGGNCQNKQSEKYRTPKQCLKIGVFSYLPTLVLIVVSFVLFLLYNFANVEWVSGICSVINLIVGFVLRGMYSGLKFFLLKDGYSALTKNFIEYAVNLISLIPTPIICYIAFKNGQNNKTLFKRKNAKGNKKIEIKKEKLK